MSHELSVLEQRLSRLERQNRRLTAFLSLVLIAGCLPFVLGAAQQTTDVIRASRFEVVKDGKPVVTMSFDADGGRLDVRQTSGTPVAYLRAGKYGGSLDISDKAGKTVGYFDAQENGGGILAVGNSSNQAVVNLSSFNNTGKLQLGNGDKTTVEMYSDSSGGNVVLRRAPDGSVSFQRP
ncbi:MAG TPA: hypothetical protein VGJ39_11650 [Vicinamibacterales bacterium]